MTQTRGAEIAVAKIGRWSPNDLAYIVQLDFRSDVLESATVLIVALFQARRDGGWPDLNKPMWEVTMRFSRVSGLRLVSFGGGPVQVMGFDIKSIADRGWEDIRFEVGDYEDSRIAFMCGDVEIVNVEGDRETYWFGD